MRETVAFAWVKAAASKVFAGENLTVKAEDRAQFYGGDSVRVRFHGQPAVRVRRARFR